MAQSVMEDIYARLGLDPAEARADYPNSQPAPAASEEATADWRAGFEAANARAALVLASDGGKANPELAKFLLMHSSSPADRLITSLNRVVIDQAKRTATAGGGPMAPWTEIGLHKPQATSPMSASGDDLWADVLESRHH